MKMKDLKKSIDVSLFFLCLFLFLSPYAFSSLASYRMIPQKISTMYRESIPLSDLLAQVNETRLHSYVEDIEAFGPHPTGSQALKDLRDYLFGQFSAMNLFVSLDPWTKEEWSGENIIVTLEGALSKDVTVILCAHYDSLAISPGAEDDGSGVAAVLEIADIMGQYSFNTSVCFILFSGEEQGLLGSKSYAMNASAHHQNILGVLAVDKIGYAVTSVEGSSVRHHANPSSAWMSTLSQSVAAQYPDDIGLTVLSLPQDPDSDHVSFVEQGYAGTDFVRNATNPFYHTSEDLSIHMNFSYLTKVCKLALGTMVMMASLHPRLSNHDFTLTMKGTKLSDSAQFTVVVENKNAIIDSANVTIVITLMHLFRNKCVSTIKQGVFTPCNWTVTKEIDESWQFAVAGRKFTRGFFTLTVTLFGRDDDVYLYTMGQTVGVIISPYRVMLIPY